MSKYLPDNHRNDPDIIWFTYKLKDFDFTDEKSKPQESESSDINIFDIL